MLLVGAEPDMAARRVGTMRYWWSFEEEGMIN